MDIEVLDLQFQGSSHCIASFLVRGPGGPVLIEVGPASTQETLSGLLARRGLAPADLRAVLVSHIHLDHAGAAGWWTRQGVPVYVHPRGAPHLIDPSRLLESARRIYQEHMDRLWGQTLPALPEKVVAVGDGERVQVAGLTLVAHDTPGHAGHHHAYQLEDVVFTGDVGAVRLPEGSFISIPAPPPEFDRELWKQSLHKLRRLRPRRLYLTHFGPVEQPDEHLDRVERLLDECTDFLVSRLEAGVQREQLIQEYLEWSCRRAEAEGVSKDVFLDKLQKANPLFMSVDGVSRYWRKRVSGAWR
jgi:glyoxylase-like metal-dependent hydrolase (beta-lactamase superfamily II)